MLSFNFSIFLFVILLNYTVVYNIKDTAHQLTCKQLAENSKDLITILLNINEENNNNAIFLDSKAASFYRRQFNKPGSLQKNSNCHNTKEYLIPNILYPETFNYTHRINSAYLSNPMGKKRNYQFEKIQKLSDKQITLRNRTVVSLLKGDYEQRFYNGKYDGTILKEVDTSKQKTSTSYFHQRRPHTDPSMTKEVPHIQTNTPHTRLKRAPKKPSGFVPPGLAKRPPGHGPPGHGPPENYVPHKGPPSHAGPPPNRGPPLHAGPPSHAGHPPNRGPPPQAESPPIDEHPTLAELPPDRGPQQNVGNPLFEKNPFIKPPQNTNNAPFDNRFMDGDQNLLTMPTNMNVNGNNQEISNPPTIRPPMYWFQAQPVTPEE